MKELVAREFLYFFLALTVAVPVSLLFVYLLNLNPGQDQITADEEVLEMDLLLIGALLGFIGVYIMRAIAWAVKQVIGQ